MKVGFIGTGTMGSGMAANLLKAGYEVVVHDRSRQAASTLLEAGAGWAENPAALASQVEVVLTSLPGPPEVEAVALEPGGVLEGLAEGRAMIDLSTNSPTVVRRIHAAFAGRGRHFLDAPVSGGPAGAKSGKLALWIGGEQPVFEAYRDTLSAIGDQVLYIGPVGAGSVAKLVHNCAGYAIQAVLAEVFSMGVKAGVEPLALWQAVRQGAQGRRRTFDGLAQHFLPAKYDPPAFALKLAHKDVTLATELAREIGVPMRLANLALADMTEALNRGWEGRDSRVAMKLQTERAGVEIAVDPARIKKALEEDPPR